MKPRSHLKLATVLSLTTAIVAGSVTQAVAQAGGSLDIWIRPNLFTPETLAGLQEEFPNLELRIQESPEVEPQFQAALRARSDIPDIIMLGGNVPDYYAIEEMFVDLRDYGFGDVADDYLDWKVDLGTSNSGAVIATPLDTGPYVFFYRASIMEELGFPSDPDEMAQQVETWEGYYEVAEAVAEAGMFACDAASSVLLLGNNQEGFAFFERVGDDVQLAIDSPVLQQNFTRAGDFVNRGLCANVTPTGAEWSAAVAQDVLVGFTGPVYHQVGLKRVAVDSAGDWRVTSTPGGMASAKGSFIAVTAASEHPTEAAQVIYWLSNAENQVRTYRDLGPYPSTPGSFDDPVFHEPDPFYDGQVLVEVLQPVLEGAPRVVVGPYGDNVSAIFRDALTDLAAAGGGDVEATYNNAVQTARSALGQ